MPHKFSSYQKHTLLSPPFPLKPKDAGDQPIEETLTSSAKEAAPTVTPRSAQVACF